MAVITECEAEYPVASRFETRQGFSAVVEYEPEVGPWNDPRDWSNASVMVCGHRDYSLGDEQVQEGAADGYGSVRNWLIATFDADRDTISPLYLYDHSGISMSVGSPNRMWLDDAGWDTSMVGFAFTTPATREETGVTLENAQEAIRQEVATYDAFLRGEVYGYRVLDRDGETVECCGGFVGDQEGAEADAKAELTFHADQAVALATREAVGL